MEQQEVTKSMDWRLKELVAEKDQLTKARMELAKVAQLPNMGSIPNHVMTTLGWLLLHHDDTQQECELLWKWIAKRDDEIAGGINHAPSSDD